MSISVETLALAKKAGPNVEEINGLKEQINNFYFGYDADRNPGYSTDGKNFFPFKSSVARAFVNISDCICLDVTGFTHLTLLSILEKSEQTTGCYIYANDVYSTKIIYESLDDTTTFNVPKPVEGNYKLIDHFDTALLEPKLYVLDNIKYIQICRVNAGAGSLEIKYSLSNKPADWNNDYLELEYIQSDGVSYIDTDYIVKAGWHDGHDFELIADVMIDETMPDTYNYEPLFGSSDDDYYNKMVCVYAHGPSTDHKVGYKPETYREWGRLFPFPFNEKTHIILKRYSLQVNDKIANSPDTNGRNYEVFSSTYPMLLFTYNVPSNIKKAAPTKYARFCSFKIIYDGEVVRDMVPVMTKGTNIVGMFDKISNKLYGNAAADGELLAGPIV